MRLSRAKIDFLRIDKGWSYSELARKAGLSKAQLSEMLNPETSGNKGSPASWKRIADALEVAVHDILVEAHAEEAS
jgi:transcriptional regulator with XRE-family HTH domain